MTDEVAVLEVMAAPSAVVAHTAATFGGGQVAGLRFREHAAIVEVMTQAFAGGERAAA